MTWVRLHIRKVAITIGAACLLLAVTAMTLNTLILLGYAPGGPVKAINLFYDPGLLALAIFGVLIIIRRPDHVMGWLFCLIGFMAMIIWATNAYEQFAGAERLPGLVLALSIQNSIDISHMLLLLMIVPLLFPNGQLLSRRWRPLLILAIVIIVITTLGGVFAKKSLGIDDRQENLNPLWAPASASLEKVLTLLAYVVIPVALFSSIAALILRYRRSHGIERLQIRWLLWILSLIIMLLLFFLIGEVVTPNWINASDGNWTLLEIVLGMTILSGLSIGVPVVLGLSILRYRLYDIDRIFNRTLVYGSLTLLLGLSFAASIGFFQLVLSPLTRGNDLAVAGSTLLVAALFRPVRGRIQQAVDRRFYRRRYDANQTLRAFSATARNAVNLDQLHRELVEVIAETVQPQHLSIWLRPSEDPGNLPGRIPSG